MELCNNMHPFRHWLNGTYKGSTLLCFDLPGHRRNYSYIYDYMTITVHDMNITQNIINMMKKENQPSRTSFSTDRLFGSSRVFGPLNTQALVSSVSFVFQAHASALSICSAKERATFSLTRPSCDSVTKPRNGRWTHTEGRTRIQGEEDDTL